MPRKDFLPFPLFDNFLRLSEKAFDCIAFIVHQVRRRHVEAHDEAGLFSQNYLASDQSV